MSAAPRTLLGFDFGFKRIGVAVGQELTRTASPLITLTTHNDQPPWDDIDRIVQDWRPQALVLGLPVTADSADTAMTQAVRRFGKQLRERYNLTVYWIDERLTSSEAQHILSERAETGKAAKTAKARKHQKLNIDKVAAQLILQTFMRCGVEQELT